MSLYEKALWSKTTEPEARIEQQNTFVLNIPEECLTMGSKIGRGTFSDVYIGKMHSPFCNSEVALKCAKIFGKNLLEVNKLIKEKFEHLVNLNHKNVVLYIGLCFRKDLSTIVIMELINGGNLFSFLQYYSMDILPHIQAYYAFQIVRGMNYLHSRGIIHKDLKTKNIMMTIKPTEPVDILKPVLKLINFDCPWSPGTVTHMSPEAMNNKYSTKSDVWSFGVTFWEILTRDLPFTGLQTMQVIYRIGILKKTLEIPINCDPVYSKIIMDCWIYDTEKRITFDAILYTIESLLRGKFAKEIEDPLLCLD